MTYRNGKCYDSRGNEMTTAQVNMLYYKSISYIESLKQKDNPVTEESIIDKLSKNTLFKISKFR